MTRRRSARAFIVVALSVAAIAPLPAHAIPLFNFTGYVRDPIARPLAGASVADQYGHTAVTDAQGRYTLPESNTGTYTLRATMAGMYDSPAVTVTANLPIDRQVDFTLEYVTIASLSHAWFSTADGPGATQFTVETTAPSPGTPGQSGGKSCVYVTDSRTGSTLSAIFEGAGVTPGYNRWGLSVGGPQDSPQGIYALSHTVKDCDANTRLNAANPGTKSYGIDNIPPSIDPDLLTPLNDGNSAYALQRLMANVTDSRSGPDSTTMVFTLDGIGYPASWSPNSGWAKTASLTMTPGTDYQATFSVRDLAGNHASYAWGFRSIEWSFDVVPVTLSGAATDSGLDGAVQGTRRWHIDPVIEVAQRTLHLPNGSRHSGYTTTAANIPLGGARVHYLVNGQPGIPVAPYPIDEVRSLYQQLVLVGSRGPGRGVISAPAQAGLTRLDVDLPLGSSNVSIQFDQLVTTTTNLPNLCPDREAGPANCAPDPIRFYIDEEFSDRVAPRYPASASPSAGTMQKIPDPNLLDEGGIWKGINPLELIPSCALQPTCGLGGVNYPIGLDIVPPQVLGGYCTVVRSCSSERIAAREDDKYYCIGWEHGWDNHDGMQPDRCQQPFLMLTNELWTASPRTRPGNRLHKVQVVFDTAWGFEDALRGRDSLGIHYWTPADGNMRIPLARADDVPLGEKVAEADSSPCTYCVYPQDVVTGEPYPDAYSVGIGCYSRHQGNGSGGRLPTPSARQIIGTDGQAWGVGTGSASDDVSDDNAGGFPQHVHIVAKKLSNGSIDCAGGTSGTWVSADVRVSSASVVAWVQPIDTVGGGTHTDGALLGSWGHLVSRFHMRWDLFSLAMTAASCVSGASVANCAPWGVIYSEEERRDDVHTTVALGAFDYQ